MSVNININKMNYNGRSYAECAEANKRKINRILSVREQSSDLAQKLLRKTRTAKEQELKKLQQIREKELGEWKRKTQCQIQSKIDDCITNFGDAHIAAVDASCEEDESLRDRRDEQDLMAAMRGRVAMLQIQRERERELEDKLLKKKRSQQKTIGIQADFLAQKTFSKNLVTKKQIVAEESEEESNEIYSTKPNHHNHHRHSEQQYNPQNYTSHSVDSSNNCDSENDDFVELIDDDSSRKDESEFEFNQISNLLRHKVHKSNDSEPECHEEIESSDSESISLPYKKEVVKKVTIKQPKKGKGILKKSPKVKKATSPVKSRKELPDNRVRYVDYGNKYETTYVPDKNLIVRNEKSRTNAKENAQMQTDDDLISKRINQDILKQLTELRSQEALEKEKIRRDYERLRFELDELSKQEQEARTKVNATKSLSRDQLLRKEELKQKKLIEAAENAMKRNIITCPPVDSKAKPLRPKSNELNVAAPSQQEITSTINLKRSNSEINNLVKIEKLKDLLEKINHQKRLLLNEIEKSDDIPGPDLEKVMDCISKLEKEKAALSSDAKIDESKVKKMEELNEREKKIQERELRLESKLLELFKKQKEQPVSDSSSSASEKSNQVVQPPVEIIIKVQQPKTPSKKSRKSFKCIDTLNRQPGKVYPKTPVKKNKPESEAQKIPTAEKLQQETQTSPVPDAPKPILKSSKLKSISIPPVAAAPSQQKQPIEAEDFSLSTVYRELPPQIQLTSKESQKSQRKLNPLLMDYITRLLGMNKNIEHQLNVDVSSITTPGSSTINTSENISSSTTDVQFDGDRMNRLQKFIDDNHSFITEINESIEKVEKQTKQDKNMEKVVEGIWRDILLKKKSQGSKSRSVQSSKTNLPQTKPKKTKAQAESVKSTATKPKITQDDMSNVTKYIDSQMLNNYTEYTANCQRRISELSSMMEKVRQEKKKLIENSLSSNEYNNFTEYREIAQTTAASKENAENTGSTDAREDPPSEEINNILQFQTRPFGVSKDSGISVSRPVTSSDFRDSPDVRVVSEENSNNLFQPILKDITKPRLKMTSVDGETQTIRDVSSLIRQQQHDEKQQKKQKPPLSLKSPQFEKQQHEPHELSTIVEIETPTASKVNIVPDETSGVGAINTFINFDEYSKDPKKQTEMSFPDLNDLKQALTDMSVKTFVDRVSYMDISEEPGDENLSNASSLMDIMEELKKRNLFEESFQIYYEDENREVGKVESTPTKVQPVIAVPESPKQKPAQSRIVKSQPEKKKTKIDFQMAINMPEPKSPMSNDTLSGIQEIENDCQAEKKRKSSTSSDEKRQESSMKLDIEFETSSTSSDGKPLNLKDFLRRELLTRSRKDENLSDDSSLSARFIKSLLKASNSSSSSSSNDPRSESSQNIKLRTSTPVRMSSDNLVKTGASSQIFVGAESVSTVKDSSDSSKDKSN